MEQLNLPLCCNTQDDTGDGADDDGVEFDVAQDNSEKERHDEEKTGTNVTVEEDKTNAKLDTGTRTGKGEGGGAGSEKEESTRSEHGSRETHDEQKEERLLEQYNLVNHVNKENEEGEAEENEGEEDDAEEYLPYKQSKHCRQKRRPSTTTPLRSEQKNNASPSSTSAGGSPARISAGATVAAGEKGSKGMPTAAAASPTSDKSGNWIWSDSQFRELVLQFNTYVRGMPAVEILKIGKNFWVEAASIIGCSPNQAKGKWTNTKANFVWDDTLDTNLMHHVRRTISKSTRSSASSPSPSTTGLPTAAEFADIGDRMTPMPIFATMCKQRWMHLESSAVKTEYSAPYITTKSALSTPRKMSGTPPIASSMSNYNNVAQDSMCKSTQPEQNKRKRGRPKRADADATSLASDLKLQSSPHHGARHYTRLSRPDESDADSPDDDGNQLHTPKTTKRQCLSPAVDSEMVLPVAATAGVNTPAAAAVTTTAADNSHTSSSLGIAADVATRTNIYRSIIDVATPTSTSLSLGNAVTTSAAACNSTTSLLQHNAAAAAAAATATSSRHTEDRYSFGGAAGIRLNREFNGDYYTFADVDALSGPLVRIEKSPKRAVHLIQMYTCEIERTMDEYTKPFSEVCRDASNLLRRISQWKIDQLVPMHPEQNGASMDTSDASELPGSEYQSNAFYIKMFHNTFLEILRSCPEVSLEHPSVLSYNELYNKLIYAAKAQ